MFKKQRFEWPPESNVKTKNKSNHLIIPSLKKGELNDHRIHFTIVAYRKYNYIEMIFCCILNIKYNVASKNEKWFYIIQWNSFLGKEYGINCLEYVCSKKNIL